MRNEEDQPVVTRRPSEKKCEKCERRTRTLYCGKCREQELKGGCVLPDRVKAAVAAENEFQRKDYANKYKPMRVEHQRA